MSELTKNCWYCEREGGMCVYCRENKCGWCAKKSTIFARIPKIRATAFGDEEKERIFKSCFDCRFQLYKEVEDIRNTAEAKKREADALYLLFVQRCRILDYENNKIREV